ncbi:MAG: ABC-F family ATP-binding cassette domain-containing protein [Thermodesulfobacteriota bacterium]
MITITGFNHSFKGKKIFDDLDWSIKKNKKYGLVGLNGTGKTTLLEAISGSLETESGSVSIPKKIVIGYLSQDLKFDQTERKIVEEALSALLGSSGIDEYELDRVKFQAEKILMGLGFEKKQLEEKTSTLSGGWKMRIELAKLLLKGPNILLLDEPTNHLDIQSIGWIENYLNNFNGTVVLVSHDKYLLDRMVDTIAELENGKIKEYKGNYSHYIVEKEEQRQIQLSTFKNQQKKVLETERFIERFRAKNTKATQVQSRVKMLEKMKIVDAPESYNKKIKLKFPEAKRSGRVVCEISEFSKEYKTQEGNVNIVFDNAGPLKIERGDKIALAGKNGEGKTTLAKLIVGIEKFNGESTLGHNVELAYYAQNQEDNLNLENTLYSEFVQVSPHFSNTQVRSMLGSFLFNEDDLEKKVKVLSGGEKSRLSLSKMLVSPSNFLLLDEPTNHLDIQSREILLEALKNYTGTFLVISHDRYFIDQLVNKVWYVEDGKVETYLGNYSDYINKLNGKDEVPVDEIVSEVKEVKVKENKKEKAEQRNRLYRELQEKGIENMDNWKQLTENQLSNALRDLEKRIADNEIRKSEIEKQLHDPELFNDQEEAVQKTKDFDELNSNLFLMYKRWDELTEHIK